MVIKCHSHRLAWVEAKDNVMLQQHWLISDGNVFFIWFGGEKIKRIEIYLIRMCMNQKIYAKNVRMRLKL